MGADSVEMPDFPRAPERVRIFGDEIDHLIEPLRECEGRTGERLDEGRANAVALGVPLVLLRDGAADTVEAGVERAVAVECAHQAPEQRRDGDGVVQPRAAVGDAQFDGRIIQRRPYRPPYVARIGNDFCPRQCGNELAIVVIGAEQFGQAGARQLVVGGKSIAHEAGEVALPERRGRREREQQRKVWRQPHDQVDARVGVGHSDVDMHAAQHVAVSDHLKVIHDGAVARLRRHHLLRPIRERKSAHRGECRACVRQLACPSVRR